MKRSWLGFSLLILLLILSLLVTGFMTRVHEDIAQSLRWSGECAAETDWDGAELFFQRARREWRRWEHLRACFADHDPIEDIDASLAALEVYLQNRETLPYTAACASLSRQVAAVGEAHQPVWWNLL